MKIFSVRYYEYLRGKLGGDEKLRELRRYPNGELYIKLKSDVRGERCTALCASHPPAENLLESLLLIHTLKKEGASEVVAVFPYLGYSRHDKIVEGESLAAEMIGRLVQAAGASKVVTVDLHSKRDVDLFPIPIESISPNKIFAEELGDRLRSGWSLVVPDEGAIERGENLLAAIGAKKEVAHFKKTRTETSIELSGMVGTVSDKVIILDDILDTGITLIKCAEKLREKGVKEIVVGVTHALFTGDEWWKLFDLAVSKIYCANTLAVTEAILRDERIKQLDISQIVKCIT